MKRTMKAAVLHKIRDRLRIEQVPVPAPGRGEVLIKVMACGVCHSDLHAIDGDWSPLPTLPLIPGHEAAGHVIGLGDGVTDLKVGDAVGVPWMYSACGKCEFCWRAWRRSARQAKPAAIPSPAAMRNTWWRTRPLSRLPKDADFYQLAPILCAGVTTYRGPKRTNARPGQRVAVVGIGGLGHIAVQYAKAVGYRVAAVDVADEQLRLAKARNSPSTAAIGMRRRCCGMRSAASTARS
jgi:alcohol dehydrogenase, propanol-preferring